MAEPPKKMRSLYADLLDDGPSTISGAAVKYNATKAESASTVPSQAKKTDAAFQYQPIKRPQAKTKAKPASGFVSKSANSTGNNNDNVSGSSLIASSDAQLQVDAVQQPSTIDQWRGDPDENAYWAEQRRQERRAFQKDKKNRKKNKDQFQRQWNWDDIYDLEAPNNHLAYKGSDAHYDAISRWKRRLYHRPAKKIAKQAEGEIMATGELKQISAPTSLLTEPDPRTTKNASMFAPPPIDDSNPPLRSKPLTFAPPPIDNVQQRLSAAHDEESDDGYGYPTARNSKPSYNDHEDHAPRVAFASAQSSHPALDDLADEPRAQTSFAPMSFSSSTEQSLKLPPEETVRPQTMSILPIESTPAIDPDKAAILADAKARGLEKLKAIQARLNAAKPATSSADTQPPPPPPPPPPPLIDIPPPPPAENSSTIISRAPVRYDPPTEPPPIPEEPPAPKETSKRPGQIGFAKRLMMKQGWKEGQGLGANADGVTTAIIAKAEKRKRRPDAEGGGWAQPANMGRIVGGKRRKISSMGDDDGSFGQPSCVVRLAGLLDGLDVDFELENGTLMQDIGARMETNGSIKRIFVWRESLGGNNDVFVEFNVELSALRAVNSTDGELFEGNQVVARFFSEDKFRQGEYA